MSPANQQQEMTFYALDARFRGEELRYNKKNQSVAGFSEADSFKNELYWYFYPFEEAAYQVDIEYSCGDSTAGKEIYFTNSNGDDGGYKAKAENTGGNFRSFSLGEISAIADGERNLLVFGVSGDDENTDLQVRKIVLTRMSKSTAAN